MQYAASRFGLAAVLALLIAPAACEAASVTSDARGLKVNSGAGFVDVSPGVELAAGASHGAARGVALISYASDCAVRVGSGVWFVQDKRPCAPGETLIDFTGRMRQQPPPGPDQPPPTGLNGTALVIGGVVVAAGVGLAVVISNNNNNNNNNSNKDKPASP